MSRLLILTRLARMRLRTGAGPVESVTWAAGLIWRGRSTPNRGDREA